MSGKISERQDAVKPTGDGRTSEGDAMSELVVHVFRLNGLLTGVATRWPSPPVSRPHGGGCSPRSITGR